MAIEKPVDAEQKASDIVIISLGKNVNRVRAVIPSGQEVWAYEIEGCIIEGSGTPIRLFCIANEQFDPSNGFQKTLSPLRNDLPPWVQTYVGPPINAVNPQDLSLQNRPYNNAGLYLHGSVINYPNDPL